MKCYRWQKWGCILFLVGMVVIGYLAIPLPGNEIFPFYSWTMFSVVPSQEEVYVIVLKEFNGQVFNPPIEFQHAGNLVINQRSIVAYRDIQKMGQAYTLHDDKSLRELRELFEKNYLLIGTKYQLIRTNYDPLIRWKTGKRTMEPLQEWTRTE